jgi:hypothetical protein
VRLRVTSERAMRLALCIRGGIESGPRMGREMDSFETEMEERERLGLGRGRRERRKLGCRGRFLTPEGERVQPASSPVSLHS